MGDTTILQMSTEKTPVVAVFYMRQHSSKFHQDSDFIIFLSPRT